MNTDRNESYEDTLYQLGHISAEVSQLLKVLAHQEINSSVIQAVKAQVLLHNLIALCLVCHDEAHYKGGFIRSLDVPTLRKYRDDWIDKVERFRQKAAALAYRTGVRAPFSSQPLEPQRANPIENKNEIVATVSLLPALRRAAYDEARPLWNRGNNASMREGTYNVQYVTETSPQRANAPSADKRTIQELERFHETALHSLPSRRCILL